MVDAPQINPTEYCIKWFLSKYPHTSNAFVDGTFLVYAVDGPNIINNWDEKYRTDSSRNTTLSDLLTHVNPTKPNSIFPINVVPVKREYEDAEYYDHGFINLFLIREIKKYFRARGIEMDGDDDSTLTTMIGTEDDRSGTTLLPHTPDRLHITARLDLWSLVKDKNITLADAVGRIFDSYWALFGSSPLPYLIETKRFENLQGPSPKLPE